MRKSMYISLLASFLLSMMIISTVSATKWLEVEPQEVVDSAEVIIMGKYDFSSKPKSSKFIFQGFDFNIEKVYKGDISEQITAGIDSNDTGWAEEHQEEGGEFLLFLEKSKDAKFLIPVGGPNGMIQVYNGKVIDSNDEKRTFFENFLKTTPEKAMDTKSEIENNKQNDKSFPFLLLYVIGSLIVGLAVFFLLYRYKKKQ